MHVLVMAKAPVAGRVKTRLCPPCTPLQAAELAEAALADTLEAVAGCRSVRRILALDGDPGSWLPPGFDVVPQVDGGLARRLAAAWSIAGGPGLQIGMDTPQVTSGLLDDSLARLDAHIGEEGPAACLLGPAVDGGWWALGLAQDHPGLFDGIPMSTSRTCRAQERRCRSLGLSVEHLATLRDVDDASDARIVAALVPGSRFAEVATAVFGVVALGSAS